MDGEPREPGPLQKAKDHLGVLSVRERPKEERRGVLDEARGNARYNALKERINIPLHGPWDERLRDSSLLPEDSTDVSDFGYISFQETFETVLPPHVNIRDYIESQLAPKKGSAVAIEIGGPGRQAFRDFTPGFFQRTMGLSLTDIHRASEREFDEWYHHTVIEGDFFDPKTIPVINKWLAGQKASLIMERMMGGLIYTPQDARTLGKRLRQMYGLLDPQKGVMFVQVPRKIYKPAGVRETDFERATLQDPAVYRDYLGRWVKMIHSDHQGVLDVQWDGAAALRLVRNPGAPAELPVIEFK